VVVTVTDYRDGCDCPQCLDEREDHGSRCGSRVSAPNVQQRDAALSSARARRTRQLERLILTSPPLTREQRDRIIAAACRLPVILGNVEATS